NGRGHLAGHVRVLERVRVDDALVRYQFLPFPAEAVAVAAGEVTEGHPVTAADARVERVDGAGEAVGRQPLGLGRGVGEGAEHAFGRGGEHAVETDGSCHGPAPVFGWGPRVMCAVPGREA